MTDKETETRGRAEFHVGRKIGAELFKLVREGKLTKDEYAAKLSSLTPDQLLGAREVIQTILRVGGALNRIQDGTAPINLDLEPDPSGYFDRTCPSTACGAYFKISWEDWKSKNFKELHCPICRHRADHNLFDTPTQREHVQFRGQKLVETELARALPGISFEVAPLDHPIPRDLAVKIERILERATECEACGCRYAALTYPFFCPACGHRSSPSAFEMEIKTVRQALQAIPTLRTALAQSIGQQEAENFIKRNMIELNFRSLVGAFQSAAEARFLSLPNPAGVAARKNAFQNLIESSDLWKRVTGRDFPSMLLAAEWQELQRLFQQRHKFDHTGGIVDQDYLAKTGDTTYEVGDRIVVTEATVERLTFLVSKLMAELLK